MSMGFLLFLKGGKHTSSLDISCYRVKIVVMPGADILPPMHTLPAKSGSPLEGRRESEQWNHPFS